MTIRHAILADQHAIFQLYRHVTQNIGGLARVESEITPEYIAHNLEQATRNGMSLVALSGHQIVGEIHAYRLVPQVFAHVFSELTIAVHPDFQGKGIGKQLFTEFLTEVEMNHPEILRVELIARESNQKAIQFYQKLGFQIEGRLERRIANKNGFEADIPMAWLKKIS